MAESDSESADQLFLSIQFGGDDDPPLMVPVDDPAILEDDERRQALIDSAWPSYVHWMFARDTVNPEFIRSLAEDFSRAMPVSWYPESPNTTSTAWKRKCNRGVMQSSTHMQSI